MRKPFCDANVFIYIFFFSVFYSDIDAEHEFLENLEEYLPLMLESEGKISNISIFIDSIEDFYFDGNITLNFNNNITEVDAYSYISIK